MKKVKYFKFILLVVATSIISLAFLNFDDGDDFELIKNLEIYHSVMKELRLNYVDEIQSAELITYSISQLLEQLDPYTIYYPENLVEDYTFMNTGEFGGIGMTVEIIDNKFIITDIMLNKPAFNSGIKIGDQVIKIENIELDGKSLSDISTLLKGETGSFVKKKYKIPRMKRKNTVLNVLK
jgi:carboxyl-terminal processing protease